MVFHTASVNLFVEVAFETEHCVFSDVAEKTFEEKFRTEFRWFVEDVNFFSDVVNGIIQRK